MANTINSELNTLRFVTVFMAVKKASHFWGGPEETAFMVTKLYNKNLTC